MSVGGLVSLLVFIPLGTIGILDWRPVEDWSDVPMLVIIMLPILAFFLNLVAFLTFLIRRRWQKSAVAFGMAFALFVSVGVGQMVAAFAFDWLRPF